jgi:hypothetical protein
MPDPLSHHTDMTTYKTETMPRLWWLTPWTFAIQQWNARSNWYMEAQIAKDQAENSRSYMVEALRERNEAEKKLEQAIIERDEARKAYKLLDDYYENGIEEEVEDKVKKIKSNNKRLMARKYAEIRRIKKGLNISTKRKHISR